MIVNGTNAPSASSPNATPSRWRALPAVQQPDWPDEDALERKRTNGKQGNWLARCAWPIYLFYLKSQLDYLHRFDPYTSTRLAQFPAYSAESAAIYEKHAGRVMRFWRGWFGIGSLVFGIAVFAALGLTLAVIGVYGVMSHAVARQAHEIGVRMAVGAKRRHILAQFLIEAMTLTLVGGLLGIVVGILGARATTVVTGWPTIISAESVVIAFLFSLAVGLFFGLYPAQKASRLNPIEALRYE